MHITTWLQYQYHCFGVLYVNNLVLNLITYSIIHSNMCSSDGLILTKSLLARLVSKFEKYLSHDKYTIQNK